MHFHSARLPGVFRIEPEQQSDERGFFARTWCTREFRAHGLDADLVQCNVSWNHKAGTVRGLHYQAEPHGEAKLIRVVRGAIFDVLVDLRPDSKTYREWQSFELSADELELLYCPPGIAHGFQTLCDDSEILYQMSQFHVPDAARGVRWDDPSLAIPWPLGEPTVISDRDRGYPDLDNAR